MSHQQQQKLLTKHRKGGKGFSLDKTHTPHAGSSRENILTNHVL
jgi:hypothetical protein